MNEIVYFRQSHSRCKDCKHVHITQITPYYKCYPHLPQKMVFCTKYKRASAVHGGCPVGSLGKICRTSVVMYSRTVFLTFHHHFLFYFFIFLFPFVKSPKKMLRAEDNNKQVVTLIILRPSFFMMSSSTIPCRHILISIACTQSVKKQC